MGIRNVSISRLAAGLAALFALAVVLPSAASAAFQYASSFSGPGADPGQMIAPGKAEVRLSDGRLLVADSGNDRIQVFAADGTPETPIADASVDGPVDVAIDQDSGALYVADGDAIVRFDQAGALDATFTPLPVTGRIAFDQAADELVVADVATDTIRRYSAAGLPGATFDGTNGSTAFQNILDVAVDSTGDVIVVDATGTLAQLTVGLATSTVERYSSDGVFEAPIGSLNTPVTVAVEPGSDRVVVGGNIGGPGTGSYYDQPLRVWAFTAGGALRETVELTKAGAMQYASMSGVAIGAPGGRMYAVADVDKVEGIYGTVSVQAYENYPPPAIVSGPDVGDVGGTEADVTAMVDPNNFPTDWALEYSDDGGATWKAGPTGTTSGDADPVEISATLTDLEPRTEHSVRMRLPGFDVVSPAASFETVGAPPRVISQPAVQVTTSSARLVGSVDPQAAETVYWFEYGTSTDYGSRIPATDVAVGDGNSWQIAMQDLSGLQADVTYHFRLVAQSPDGTTASDDRTFTTSVVTPPPADSCPNAEVRRQQGTSQLADCRAYEQVSPSRKYNGGVTFGHKVANDGSGAGYMMNTPLSEEDGGFPAESFVSRRGPDGWTAKSTALPMRAENRGTGGITSFAFDYSDDFSEAWTVTNDMVDPADRDPRANGSGLTAGFDVYRTFLDSRAYRWESRAVVDEPLYPAGVVSTAAAGRSRDGSHIFFHGSGALLVEGPPMNGKVLYESVGGVVRTASVLPSGVIAPSATVATDAGQVMGAHDDTAISDDGRRVYWINGTAPGSLGNQLYLREDGTVTKPVSASQRASDLGTMRNAHFLGASTDGRIAYFTSTSLLTEDATTGGGLYRYDADSGSLTFLVRVTSIVRRAADDYNPDVSESGDRVYFATNSALTPDAPAGRNLYLWDGELRHVAQISPTTINLDVRLRVSRDGRYAAFSSTTSLDPRHAEGVTAIYRYDAETDELDCASCPASGMTTSNGEFRIPYVRFTIIYPANMNAPRNIADDGSVFFQTKQGLAPRDSNGTYDVYHFDGERTNLLTSGKGTIGSEIADNSDDGKSIFFVTTDSLTGSDIDNGYPDMYVARVGGGFPEPPPPPAACGGDGCQDDGRAGPPAKRPLSTGTLPGDGNVDAKRARAARLTVAAAKARGAIAALRVRLSSAGVVTARGATVKRATVRASKAGARRVRVVLNARGKRALARKGTVRARVTVAFKPRSGASVRRSVQITFERKGR